MRTAPIGAFGVMAFAVGKYGVSSLTSLGGLILLFYSTAIIFVVVVLGSVMAYLRLDIFSMLRYLKEELLLILGTSTAEPALPGLMRKLKFAGVKRETVGLVVPTGHSFNLDGAAITCRSPPSTSPRPPTPTSASASRSASSRSCY